VLIARKIVDDAIQGLGAIVGVQGRNTKVTRSGERNGRFHGFAITNLRRPGSHPVAARTALRNAAESLVSKPTSR